MEIAVKSKTDEEFELELKYELMDDDEMVRKKAINRLFGRHAKGLMRYARHHFWYFEPEQIAEVVEDAFLNLYNAISEPGFDFDKPLIAFLIYVTRCRCVDEVRRNRPTEKSDDQFISAVAVNLKDTATGDLWNEITSKGCAREIQEDFVTYIEKLPKQQRFIAQAIKEFYPDYFERPDEIIDWIFETTGQQLTYLQVKGALEAFRIKFDELLRNKKRQ